MRHDMMFAVCISFFEYESDVNFVCKKLSDVDFYIKDQLNDRNLKFIVIDVVDFYESDN